MSVIHPMSAVFQKWSPDDQFKSSCHGRCHNLSSVSGLRVSVWQLNFVCDHCTPCHVVELRARSSCRLIKLDILRYISFHNVGLEKVLKSRGCFDFKMLGYKLFWMKIANFFMYKFVDFFSRYSMQEILFAPFLISLSGKNVKCLRQSNKF